MPGGSGALIERQVKHLCQMQSAAFCQLRNLLLAAEAIGDNQSLRIRFPYCRQKHALAAGHRDVIFLFFKSKRARHAATARLQHLAIKPKFLQRGDFVVGGEHGLLMAVPVNQGLAVELRRLELWRSLLQEFAEQECLPG